uniref:Uncharacterized protein n=1 Tax=Anopheles atroparvus TaxID=41427 RepID=A0AAG5DMR0_ANOAO
MSTTSRCKTSSETAAARKRSPRKRKVLRKLSKRAKRRIRRMKMTSLEMRATELITNLKIITFNLLCKCSGPYFSNNKSHLRHLSLNTHPLTLYIHKPTHPHNTSDNFVSLSRASSTFFAISQLNNMQKKEACQY